MSSRRRLVAAGVALAALAALALAASLVVAPYPVPTFEAVRADWRSSDAWLVDRHGEPLSRLRIDRQRRRGDWVALGDASPALIDALLASEDRRFHEHRGIDWRALGGAVRQWLAGGRRGGSTVTMQLAAWLHPELGTGGRRGLVDKWRQLRAAAALERSWTKAEILEAWLNLTPFRGEIEGIDAAARVLAGRSAAALDRVDAALLASLVPAPNAPWATVVRRACAAPAVNADDCVEVRRRSRAAERGPPDGGAMLEDDAPHLARRLLVRPGERVTTTLDARLQRHASATLKSNCASSKAVKSRTAR
jgi:penicillin-binding protein 1C